MKTAIVHGAAGFLFLLSAGAALSAPTEVTINDTNVFPESITSTSDGTVIIGSLVKPVIYRGLPGAASADPWIHFTGDQAGTTLGVLADAPSKTLWACVIEYPADTPRPPAMNVRHASIRSFDLATGAFKARYPLPSPNSSCNDFAIAPDHTVYVSDTLNGQIDRLKPGAAALEPWLQDKQLAGIDGITFMGGVLYANTVGSGHIFRIPIGADGSAGVPVDIKLSQPLSGPDGMRAEGNRIFVAENRAGQVSELRFDGDSATVTVIKTGYQSSTAVSPVGNMLWVGESKQNYWRAPDEGKDPNPFLIHVMPLPQ